MSAEKDVQSILMAEQMSVEAAKKFANQETLAGRPTFFYDHEPNSTDAETEKSEINIDAKRVRLVYQPSLTPEKIKETTASGTYSGLMVRPKNILAGTNVEFAVRVGTGINNFSAWKQEPGHTLMNTPGQNAGATAEYAVKALLRLLAPTLFDKATEETLEGKLTSADLTEHFSTELQGKRIAVIGMGDIGTCAARILKYFNVDVVGWGYTREDKSRSFTEEDAANMGIEWADTVEDALTGADATTLHVPGGATALITDKELAAMKPGAKIVNAARGPVIDAKALGRAIEARHVTGFIVDADWFNDKDDPLAPYVALIEKYHGTKGLTLLSTPHFGGDVTAETNFNATMQGLKQLSAALWDRTIYNANSTIPADCTDDGVQKPKGIGRVMHAEVNAVIGTNIEELLQASTLIAKLTTKVGDGETLSPQETEQLMVAANTINHTLPTGRPVEQSMAI